MSQIIYLNQVHIEFGALGHLQNSCEQHHIDHALIVTDPGIKAAGILDRVLGQCAAAGLRVSIFDQTPSNPTERAVHAARAIYVEQGCNGLIALGGGSALDCAKGVAIAVHHPGPLKTYATIEGGSTKITANLPPLIAIPTTAGTGSEVARGAIIIVEDGRKLGFHNWHLVPKTALLDPELTLDLPPKLTAATGMDAITHCMETFISAAFNPLTSSHELDISDLENPAGLRFIKLLGKQRWRDIIQRRMRSKMIIVLSPGFDLFLGVLKRHKPVGV